MKERVKAYYEYLIKTDPRFKKFVEDTKDLDSEEFKEKFNLVMIKDHP